MKKIDEYIESVYKDLGNSNEILELKSEMKIHLTQSVQELQAQNNSEEESIRLAIERFGEPGKLIKEIHELYRIRKTFAKWLLKIALLFGVFGLLWLIPFYAWNEYYSEIAIREFFQEVGQKAKAGEIKDTVPSDLKESVIHMVDHHTGGVKAVGIKFKRIDQTDQDIRYELIYPPSAPLDHYGLLNGKKIFEGIFTYDMSKGLGARIQQSDREINVDVIQWRFSPTYFLIGISLLFGYWILFATWASMNVYYNRNGNLKWVLLFVLLNALGYWMYLERNKLLRNRQSIKWLRILIQILSVYIVYTGVSVFFIQARGDVLIKKLGVMIPLNDHDIMVHGTVFILIGFVLFAFSFLVNRLKSHKATS